MLLPLLLAACQSPDVLVVVLDDVARADVLEIQTPNLDALAQRGRTFTRAYSMPSCSPTRMSMFFGQYEPKNAGPGQGLPDECTPSFARFSLAKQMKGAGYATGLFGKWHLGTNAVGDWSVSPHLHGFDVWRSGRKHNPGGHYAWERVDDGVVTNAASFTLQSDVDELLHWWTTVAGPRFAVASFSLAHAPFEAPPEAWLPPGYVVADTPRGRFEAMVVACDTALGILAAGIDLERTILVVVGDNGTPRAVAPGLAKGHVVERGVNVPMLWVGRGIAPGESDALVHVVDFMATLGDLCGTTRPVHAASLDSRSFAPALAGRGGVRKHVYVSVVPPSGAPRRRAAISRRWKLHRTQTEELFDLATDPLEEHPLDPDGYPVIAGRLRAVLDANE